MKNLFRRITKKLLLRNGFCVHRVGCFDFFQSIMGALLRKNDELFFIQIGANDGKSFDPMYDFVTNNSQKVRGILLEPLDDYYQELIKNYKGFSNVTLLNLAIHNSKKEITMYQVDPTVELPKYTKGLASFSKNHAELHDIPKEAMIKKTVQCISLSDLLIEHQVSKIDVLQIDTEGYDSEIILNLDFNAIKPKIIHFEHLHLSGVMSKDKFIILTDLLHKNGYELWMDKYDATAYQRDIPIDL